MARNVWLLVRVLVITKLDVELSSREREREICICAERWGAGVEYHFQEI